MNITLKETCGGCPEQYDALDEHGKVVGYLRLRHGHFTVRCPDASGALVYEAHPRGDGIFESDERAFYLQEAKIGIQRYWSYPHEKNGSGVKVLKRGKIPNETFRGTCTRCQSELEALREDCKVTSDQRDGTFGEVICPVCHYRTILYPVNES